ncbi:MAG: lipoprotein [Yersiniaceae bacterium]|uniref:Lipoprotein n=1 Tax=Chimaeribacter coloradensis TaxID=2060068 RepID=A0A2N5ECH7_9GAMM|nr:lipoprotein [Chimaeribacter coloradensis]MDU6411294.1 lipoprotein [Yersiniaceae bacterium]PLR40245.1 lipoprotein [Chimaeribacter coloradensis]
MKNNVIAAVLPLALLLSACTTPVEPAFAPQDNGSHATACVEGGPDTVAQKFYETRIQQRSNGIPAASTLATYRPYLSDALYTALREAGQGKRVDVAATPNENTGYADGDLFSSLFDGPTNAAVATASTIPNRDARNIPLRVNLINQKPGSDTATQWQDEILMVREGQCWVVDDIRYLGPWEFASSGTLRQVLENR